VKVTKKDIQEAKSPDVVLEGATSVYDWLVERRNIVIGALVALLVVAAIATFASSSSEAKAHEAGGKLAQALELANRPVVEVKEGATPAEKTFPTKAAKLEAVEKALNEITTQYAGSEAARTASLQLADVKLEAGKADEAIAGYEKYLADAPAGGLRLFATESLGYAYEAKGDLAKAEQSFDKLNGEGAPGLALFHKARLAEKAGKKDEAKKLYEQVAKDYPGEQVANDASTRLELMDVPPAGAGALTAPEPAPVEEAPKGKKKPGKTAPAPKPGKKKIK
jgi:hypothetical protein